jgi:hypothetical protein
MISILFSLENVCTGTVGSDVGAFVGDAVVGAFVGAAVVGASVGARVGDAVVGALVGASVGAAVVGAGVGDIVGDAEVTRLGAEADRVGDIVGEAEVTEADRVGDGVWALVKANSSTIATINNNLARHMTVRSQEWYHPPLPPRHLAVVLHNC